MGDDEERRALILIVDDDDAVAELYQLVLVGAGFRVARASNGQEGLFLEEELAPDLIILDLNMPILGGLEMLRQRGPTQQARTPVLVSSADSSGEPAALAAGAALFLPKLLGPPDLLAAIDVTLRRADASVEGRRRRASGVVAEQARENLRREHITGRLDPDSPDLSTRIGALVKWLAGYYEVGVAWIDLLRRDGVIVQGAFSRSTTPAIYDMVHRVLLAERLADAESPFLVGDLHSAWFSSHPAAQAGYRFFAGAPLRGPGGVGLGALCIADVEPRAFDAANLTVLQHCGAEFGHRIARLAGQSVPGPFLFESPNVFSPQTMNVLIAAELLRTRRGRGAFELALIRVVAGLESRLPRFARSVQDALGGRSCAVAADSSSTFAVLVRGRDAATVSDRMEAALGALRQEHSSLVSAAGVVAHSIRAGGLLSTTDVIASARAVLATVPATGWMRREELGTSDDAGSDAGL